MKTFLIFIVLCLLAAVAPAWSHRDKGEISQGTFPGWSAGPVDPVWTQENLGAREARFAQDFPGRIAVFTDGSRTYIVRWVNQPTRQLHPVADCLRALGYTIEPRPIREKADHTLWGATSARRGPENLLAYERIIGTDGRAWTDVSTWFWHTAFGRAQGPWWTVTELAPAAK